MPEEKNMKQFFTANDLSFQDLEDRARLACIRFRNLEMPPGCNPQTADVGFEIQENSGAAILYVSRGINYDGADPEIQEWFVNGCKQFSSFSDLKNWVLGPLKQTFGFSLGHRNNLSDSPSQQSGSADQLTDIAAVHEGIQHIEKPLFVDEKDLFNKLSQKVIGQDDALAALAAVIARHCARRFPVRPAVLFSIGPSGVGKTRTAELLAHVLTPQDNQSNSYQFLRLDMNEYQEAHRVSQLIGAPQGYIGHGEGSQLIDTLRSNPRTIILFDEIEKAHPSILRVLMNAMDAGRLTGSSRSAEGREVDCRHSVFLFTSNLNANDILDELHTRQAFGKRVVEDEICRRRLHASGIAPEIVGRIGRFLVYKPLSSEVRASIMSLSIAEVAAEYGLNVKYVSPSVIIDLMQHAHTQNFGVRPERFLIDDVLGGMFVKTAVDGLLTPIKITGPPFECQKMTDDTLTEV
jgi:ATP-dependent Clp protease ATP-binding subunit ClpB